MKVTVCVITYNHQEYIAQALDNVLKQKTSFEYEIVVADDYSTDNTRQTLQKYYENNVNRMKLILNCQNMGGVRTFLTAYPQCQGQYVAILDGDDYWTDPNKLQIQVDFLDARPDFSISFHDAIILNQEEGREVGRFCYENQKDVSTLDDILRGNFIPTASVVFRNHLIKEFPPWYYDLPMGDISLYILLAHHGKIGFINNVMSVYRQHSQSAWSNVRGSRKRQLEISIKFWEIVKSNIKAADVDYIEEKLARHYAELENISTIIT